MGILNAIIDLIFPARCFSCKRESQYLCLSCASQFPQAERVTEEWIFPLFDYRHLQVKKALWLLKYKGRKQVAEIFGIFLSERVLEEIADLEKSENFVNPVFIPIPLSLKKLKERGFNQVELILGNMKGEFEIAKKALVKIKETPAQARIKDREERLQNVVGVFRVKEIDKIKNRNIVLIDDITTTGATLTEAKKVLLASGARKVIAFTVAH